MDDLISRKSLLEKTHMADVLHAIKGITKSVEVVLADDVEVAPSAFEGMTNGEVIKAVFPSADVEYWAEYSTYIINFPNDNDVKHFSFSWWNTPYKGGE